MLCFKSSLYKAIPEVFFFTIVYLCVDWRNFSASVIIAPSHPTYEYEVRDNVYVLTLRG